ncbi:hypothetical protein DXG01_010040 [Tephrocybe rancida]|nr:hypothetical protein DXG01_010040 [Tephrocybe rancida]
MKPTTPKLGSPPAEGTPNGSESRRTRRKRQKRSSEVGTPQARGSAQPEASGSGSQVPPSGDVAKEKGGPEGGFEEGADFIAFGFADEPVVGDEAGAKEKDGFRRDKGKGKARERTPDRERKERRDEHRDRMRDRTDERNKERERSRDGEKDRDRDRDRGRNRGDRDRDRDYDRNRDRESTNLKRKKESFDPNDGYANKKQRLDASSRKSPWVDGLDWTRCHHVAELLHKEVKAFTKYISPSPVEDEVRGLIVSLISRAVTSSFPDATVHPFGSYETKLYLPLGDIDLVILSQSMAYNDKVTVLHALANTLKRARITERVTIIAKAKVPIVKFITTHGRFNVDISVNQENGIVSGNIINGFLKDLHGFGGAEGKGSMALRSLVMITKAFLSQRSMNEVFSGGLGSYSIVCLAVSFLQMHPKIRRGEIEADDNLGVLVLEFFELYGCYFNYSEVGISVREGGTYFNKRQRGWYDYYKQELLSIEDPADPSNDISKGSFAFPKVRQTFAGAHSILTSSAYLTAGILSARRQGRSVRLQDEPAELSILSSVMGVTQETINHRKLVQELYDRRVLHNLLDVKPQPPPVTVANGSAPISNGVGSLSSSNTHAASNSVKSAWQEADKEPEHPHKRRHDPDDDDEEGRYKIGRHQPPSKRQRTGNMKDSHVTFTTDEDSASEDEKEELHYGSDIEVIEPPPMSGRSSSSRDTEKADKRRSYWLSKGVGIEDSSMPLLINTFLFFTLRFNAVHTVAGRPVAHPTLLRRQKMTTRGQPPPGNLKERIAALQQRNVSSSSPADRPSSPSVPVTTNVGPNSAGLRDKIARFEKKGGVPVPRGSFGLGAPPLAENGPLKRRGELYGNRIPGMRNTSGSRAGSPFDAGRVVSLSQLEGGEEVDGESEYLPSSPSSPSSPSVPFTGLSPQHTGSIGGITPQFTGSALAPQYTGNKEPVRGTAFATALEMARKVEADGTIEASLRPVTREASPAPPSVEENPPSEAPVVAPVAVEEPTVQIEATPAQPLNVALPTEAAPVESAPTSPSLPSTPSIVLSPSDGAEQALVISAPDEVVATTVTPVEIPVPSTVEPTIVDVPKVKDEPTETILPAPVATATPPVTVPAPANATKSVPEPLALEPSPSNISQNQDGSIESPLSASTDENSPSPVGPFTLANAVHDLGKMVANIQDMFPGQISPLATPPPYRPFVVDTPVTSKEPKAPLKSKKSIPDLDLKLDSAVAPMPRGAARVPATSSVAKPTTSMLSAPRGNARPVSMIETSPSHIAVAQRVTPATSRGVPVLVPASAVPKADINKYEHFPPTPEPNVSEFGTVSLGHRTTSHSFSHARSSTEQATNSGSFSAVVHRKVTELPPAASSSYLNFYAKVPDTPAKTPGAQPETPLSPGFGELATLLHEAALLELTLEQGELPSEAAKRGEREQKEKEKQRLADEEVEKQKQAAARAKVEEEKKKHATMTKARAKQEATESKSKSAFRNPLSRSKSGHKRDASTDSQTHKEPARSKSVLLPFRPLPQPQQSQPASRQSTPALITSIPERTVAPPTDPTPEADPPSSQTSPKSPRYFAGLRRFASSSRTSLVSNSQPRDSVSASSEMSSEDSSGIPTPPGNVGESEGGGGFFNGSGIAWPSLSPKKSPGVGRAASFTDKLWNRSRKTSTVSNVSSSNSAYETIDRITKSAAAKSAASLIPPLDPVSFTLDVPVIQENDARLPSPPELVSPRRSASLYVPSTSQFPPVYSARPTSSFYTSIPMPSETTSVPRALESVDEDKLTSPTFIPNSTGVPMQNLDALFSAKPTSPVYTRAPEETQTPSADTTPQQQPKNLDAALFSVKPTSPVYTPHLPTLAMRSEETITDSPTLLPSPGQQGRPSSWLSEASMDSSASSIPSPFFDSFPSVPDETPMPPALPGRQRNFNKPSLPIPAVPSFFETAPPLSSTVVGSEFFGPSSFVKSATVRSATLPRVSGEQHR